MYENKVGKKVWLLDGSLEHGFQLKSKDTFTIEKVKSGKECGDSWGNHFVLKHDSDGHTIEVREYQVVFALTDNNIEEYLELNEVWAGVERNFIGVVSVEIHWGDWKHAHLWCKDLMEYIGYKQIGETVTEEDGSDTYSAIHYFLKAA